MILVARRRRAILETSVRRVAPFDRAGYDTICYATFDASPHRLVEMAIGEVIHYAGQFCAVSTRHGVFYGEIVRLTGVLFLVKPRVALGPPSHAVCVDEITQITPLPDPR